jgi:sterol desaturase/sphingolipid hydroxylase (fatty acid hydroxylase superfamily)
MPEINLPPLVVSSLSTIGIILAAMCVIGFIELAIPLRSLGPWSRKHIGPNLGLTFITFAASIVFNVAVVVGLAWFQSVGFGLFNVIDVPPLWSVVIVVLALDFSFYLVHIAMHKVPVFWRVHQVHHSDPAVDVSATIRQHPLEGVIRYAYIALFVFPLGASPFAFAVYRILSAVNGLLEHANIRLPLWLDRSLSWITSWPNMHKIHHSRERRLADTSYGNIFSLWDRLFFTFTPSREGTNVNYGLCGFDQPRQQTLSGLLAAPFSEASTQTSHPHRGAAKAKGTV